MVKLLIYQGEKMKKFNIFLKSILLITFTIFIMGCQKEDKDVIKIGAILPLTGDISVYGISSKQGMEIAIEEYKDSLKSNLVITFEDDKGEAKHAINAIQKLISIDKVSAVVGGVSSACAIAMGSISEKNKTVLMIPFASSPSITDLGDYIFRIMPSDAYQAELLPKWLKELNYKKVAIISVNNEWGDALKRKFKEEFLRLGGTIVFEESLNEGVKDAKSVVIKLKKIVDSCDALFLPTYPQEGATFIKQMKEFNINIPIFGGDTWANELLIKLGGSSVENVLFLAPINYDGDEFTIFEKKYKNKYTKSPDLPATAGYDAMKVILHVVKYLKTNNIELNSDNIRKELYSIKNFRGATGITTFNSYGDVVGKAFSRRTIKNGKIINYK